MAIQSEVGWKNGLLRQGDEALLAQDLDPRQAGFVCWNARDFNITQQEFSGNLLHRQAVRAKVQQFG